MKAKLGMVAAVLAAGRIFAADVVYVNDFSTRTMAGDGSQWVTVRYDAGEYLYRNYYSTADVNTDGTLKNIGVTGNTKGQCQDGWTKCTRTYANLNNNLGRFMVSSDANPCGVFSSTMTSNAGRLSAHQPTRNSITSGVIRASADIRVPTACRNNIRGSVRMRIETAQLMDDTKVCDNLLHLILFEAGVTFVVATNNGEVVVTGRSFVLDGNAAGTQAAKAGSKSIGGGHWVRVVVEADLSSRTNYTYRSYDLGTDAPTFESQGTLLDEFDRTFLRTYNSATMGGIEGFAFRTFTPYTVALYGDAGYDDDASYKVDNLKMEWKAPGTDDFKTFYLNDFTTSRRRTIEPARGATCTYAASSAASADAYTYLAAGIREYKDYVDGNDVSLLPKEANTTTVPQPLGVDGWRRCNKAGSAQVFVTTNAGQRMVAFAHSANKFVMAMQPLGQTITNGVVRAEVDMRIPTQLTWPDQTGQTYLSLVPFEMWSEGLANQGDYQYFRAGIRMKDNTTPNGVYALCTGPSYYTGEKLEEGKWYRFTEIIDLDEDKHHFEVYPIGMSPVALGTAADATAVYTRSNLTFFAKTSGAMSGKTLKQAGIGGILLASYSTTNKVEAMPMMTNIRVWKDVGTANERLVYSNDFKTRTRYEDDVRTESLASTNKDRMFEGIDGWQRNNAGIGSFLLTSGDNPCVALHSHNAYNYQVHPLGGSYRKGLMTVQADFCPPLAWNDKDGWARIMFGNGELLAGSLVDGNGYFLDNHQFYFSMAPASAATTAGTYSGTSFWINGAAMSAAATLTTNHWYRCIGNLNLSACTGDFTLYDMGTVHPTLETANGTVIATMNDISFYAPAKVGGSPEISSVGFGGRHAMMFMRWRGDASGAPCFDNIKITHTPPGLIITVR